MWENQPDVVKLLMVLGYGAGAFVVLVALGFVLWLALLLRDGRRMRERAREAERKEHRLRVEEAERGPDGEADSCEEANSDWRSWA